VAGLEGYRTNFPVVNHAFASRLHTNSPYAIASAIVLIDSVRAAGTNMGALADYVALASLTQLKLDADTADAPTVLGLFVPPKGWDAPTGLTEWDKAYLFALYHTRMDDVHQADTIAYRMYDRLHRPASTP